MLPTVVRLTMLPAIFAVSIAFCISPKMGILLGMVSTLPLVIVHLSYVGLMGVMFCIPFDRLLSVGESAAFTVTKVMILLTFGSWLLRALVQRDPVIVRNFYERRTTIFAFIFLAASALAMTSARDFDVTANVMVKRIGVVGLYFLTTAMILDRKTLNRAINVLLFASFFVCVVGAYEMITGDQVLSKSLDRGEELRVSAGGKGASRISGTSGDPDLHAALLIMLLPLLVMRVLQARGLIQLGLTVGLLFCYMINIFWTNSRMGMLGMLGGFAGVFLLSNVKNKAFKLSAAFAVFMVFMLIMALDSSRFSIDRYTGASGSESIKYRLGWMRMSWEMGWNHPVLGVGLGNFASEYNEYRRLVSDVVPVKVHSNHNAFAHVWAEMGIIGLVSFLALLICIPIETLFITQGKTDDEEYRMLRNALLVSYFVFLFVMCAIPAIEHEGGWLIIAFMMTLGRLAHRPNTSGNEDGLHVEDRQKSGIITHSSA